MRPELTSPRAKSAASKNVTTPSTKKSRPKLVTPTPILHGMMYQHGASPLTGVASPLRRTFADRSTTSCSPVLLRACLPTHAATAASLATYAFSATFGTDVCRNHEMRLIREQPLGSLQDASHQARPVSPFGYTVVPKQRMPCELRRYLVYFAVLMPTLVLGLAKSYSIETRRMLNISKSLNRLNCATSHRQPQSSLPRWTWHLSVYASLSNSREHQSFQSGFYAILVPDDEAPIGPPVRLAVGACVDVWRYER